MHPKASSNSLEKPTCFLETLNIQLKKQNMNTKTKQALNPGVADLENVNILTVAQIKLLVQDHGRKCASVTHFFRRPVLFPSPTILESYTWLNMAQTMLKEKQVNIMSRQLPFNCKSEAHSCVSTENKIYF